ncbi:hypothetical protein MCOR14_008083 [Pyricularia oryzae]|uniref:Heavy metal tolerance protein n=1 Tax=Pyricularia grisea TaxID=148305 RepID=A0ABQ8NVW2_PYRGI|nr:hypothetical protein MCOR19_001368 [Pyricularia oryzae]KAI6302783.1 hypothetical protein MCOR33_001871 [Pyricularia grisea]KAI6455835.1 hypothetical protein MCOR15_007520 [Pyricularia oryzae]KAI6470285.1 hypothetical protein MCOR18_009065 [Pyricularia oryzae]KAI6489963.1 hypothetical protein MCOR13_008616 [Pyricularia oryzae]
MDDPTLIQSNRNPLTEAVYSWSQLLSPVILLITFILATALHGVFTSQKEENALQTEAKGPGGRPLPVTKMRRNPAITDMTEGSFGRASRRTFQGATTLIVLSFAANAANLAAQVMANADRLLPKTSYIADKPPQQWWCREESFVYVVGTGSLYGYVLLTMFDWKDSPNFVHFLVWSVSLVTDSVVLGALFARVSESYTVTSNETLTGPAGNDIADLAIGAFRVANLIGVLALYLSLAGRRTFTVAEKREQEAETQPQSQSQVQNRRRSGSRRNRENGNDETTPLLGQRQTSQNGYVAMNGNGRDRENRRSSQNGTANAAQVSVNGQSVGPNREAEAAFYRPNKLPHKTWWEYARGYSLFFPYLWPRDSRNLQLVVLLCFIILIFQRVVNVIVPVQTGRLVDRLQESLDAVDGRTMPWRDLALLIGTKILQGQSGLLGSIRAILWIPVSQYCYRALTSAAFEHVHSLSLDFHLSKRTGEVLSALNKGASINQFLEQVTFQVFPTLVDLFIAIGCFGWFFNSVYAVCVSVMTFAYLFLTVRMAATRADQRREMVNADREEEAVKNDSIVSYETVKYFNAEDFEFNRYRRAIRNYQSAEANVTWGINNMNICQNLVFMVGMLLLLIIGAYDVVIGARKIGDFAMLITYLGQLQGPLNFFGTFYRTVQQAMISGERLLELFKISPTVVDRPGVRTLPPSVGHIRWNNVKFWYDGKRPALKDISFECKPGTTTAFVGESGGGKSTIFRLMFRYYNCHEGSIEVDGNDVKDLTIDSVRRAIGVVPQDTILFNESIMYNLRYANQDATDEQVYEACKSASIHDRIMSFPEGYNTKVGERGLRLSGGEKQRVAIARLILKQPRIIMLDEATSALDSETEQQIQSQLINGNHLGQDRTLLIIAHRLSTITHADQIIVLRAGMIAEKGTHSELLKLNGKYASMWEKQSKAERAALEARDAARRAEKLARQAKFAKASGKQQDHTDDSDGCYGNTSAGSSTVLQATNALSEDSSTSDDDTHKKPPNDNKTTNPSPPPDL